MAGKLSALIGVKTTSSPNLTGGSVLVAVLFTKFVKTAPLSGGGTLTATATAV